MRKLLILIFWLSLGAGCYKDIEPDCAEKPSDGRVCYQLYLPVCGCNGKTYSNSCVAESYGIIRYAEGACP